MSTSYNGYHEYENDGDYENDRDRVSDWYRPLNGSDSGWTTYGPSGPSASDDSRKRRSDSSGTGRRRRKARTAGIIVLGVLLAVSFVYSRISDAKASVSFSDGGFTFNYSDDPAGNTPAEYPDSFEDFFDSYFTASETETTEVNIEKFGESVAFELKLEPGSGEELSLKQLYAACADSVVSIKGYTGDTVGYYWGTGVVLTADGLILTNTHVIDGCDSAEVIDTSGHVYSAALIGADAISDLAVLKIDAQDLRPAVFGESAELTVGDNVAAIGNPLGDTFTGTLTDGIISAIERDVSYKNRSMTLLQTNTALNEGNSGGPLFNMYGQVIGITNMKMMSSLSSIEGIGFAIPSTTVREVVNAIISYGEVRGRPSIGITVGQIPENVAMHYEMPEGLYISMVSEGSDAEKKGIVPGDVLTAVDGVPVTDVDQVNDIKNAKAVGETMLFTVWRDGKELEIEVALVDTNDIYK